MTTGELIKEARNRAGLKQSELAERINVAAITIGQYERGKRQPGLKQLQRIGDALGISFWDLIPDPPPDAVEPSIEEYEEMEKIERPKELRARLLFSYNALNEAGQQEAVKRVEELTEIPRYRAATTPQSPPCQQVGTDTTPPPAAPETDSEGE